MKQPEGQKIAGKISLESIQEMLMRGRGWGISEDEFKSLYKSSAQSYKYFPMWYAELYEYSSMGFFECAAEGYEFVPEDKVTKRWLDDKGFLREGCRSNVGEQYSYYSREHEKIISPSPAFLRFAKTFWTLHVVRVDLRKENWDFYTVYKFLFQLETDIANIFFPRPEIPMRNQVDVDQKQKHWLIPVIALKGAQRELILQSGVDINVDEFFTNNPILEGKIDYWSKQAYEDDVGFLKKTGKKMKEILLGSW